MFRFFQGSKAIASLDNQLDANKVGRKAATLSQLKQWGYPVPSGWLLPPGDDAEALIAFLQPSPTEPLAVRSSAVGEDSQQASAAGNALVIGQRLERDDLARKESFSGESSIPCDAS